MNIIDTAQKKFDIEQFNVEWFDSKQFIQRNKKIRRYREERRNDRIYCALFGQHDDADAVGDEKSEKKGMMPVMQGWIIGYLYDHKEEEIFQRDIEAEFYIARSTVTCLVKQMEQKGYIARVAVERDCRLKLSLSSGKRRKTS